MAYLPFYPDTNGRKRKELISHFARKREIRNYILRLFYLLLVWEDIAPIYSHMSTHYPSQA